jgi:hypothetical protein
MHTTNKPNNSSYCGNIFKSKYHAGAEKKKDFSNDTFRLTVSNDTIYSGKNTVYMHA